MPKDIEDNEWEISEKRKEKMVFFEVRKRASKIKTRNNDDHNNTNNNNNSNDDDDDNDDENEGKNDKH